MINSICLVNRNGSINLSSGNRYKLSFKYLWFVASKMSTHLTFLHWILLQRSFQFYSNCLYSVEFYRYNHWLKFTNYSAISWIDDKKRNTFELKTDQLYGEKLDAVFVHCHESVTHFIIVSNQWNSMRNLCMRKIPLSFRFLNKFYLKKFNGLINQNNLLNCRRMFEWKKKTNERVITNRLTEIGFRAKREEKNITDIKFGDATWLVA